GITEAELVWNPKASSSNDVEASLTVPLAVTPSLLGNTDSDRVLLLMDGFEEVGTIHIDIPRMSPEALILQPKVTEVGREQTDIEKVGREQTDNIEKVGREQTDNIEKVGREQTDIEKVDREQTDIEKIFERILFIWAIRHPASGYVQGINDLVTPFFVVFICEYIDQEDVDEVDVSSVPAEVLRNIEADTYWCMSKLLDGIQLLPERRGAWTQASSSHGANLDMDIGPFPAGLPCTSVKHELIFRALPEQVERAVLTP
ncbi:hypothetical protein A6R68_17571, partial [Neotoma lepida]